MVKIGSARIDENGKTHGGAAGDQNGREVMTQNWYNNKWLVIRANDPTDMEQLAYAMERACANSKIGYDQYQRDTLYSAAKPFGFDPGKVTVKCETDCSALVRVCCAYAGINVPNSPRFNTKIEPKVLQATGRFTILDDPIYTDSPSRLRRGDILCTRTTGHTVIVLSDGDMAYPEKPIMHGPINPQDVPTLKYGSKGKEVAYLQYMLVTKFGYRLPNSLERDGDYGYDGDWGEETERVFKAFQQAHEDIDGVPLKVDTECGPKSWGSILGVRCQSK